MTDVSVVIVTWRARDDVLLCLASLKEYAGIDYEAIVVDDGSGDGTPDAVRERFPDATVVALEQNRGLSHGRNRGLEHVRGRFVLMLDSDTEVKPGAIATLARVLDENPKVGLVAPKLIGIDGELQLSCRRFPFLLLPLMRRGPYARWRPDPTAHRRHMMKDWDHAAERPVVWVQGAAQMYRADLPSLIGGYDERVSSYGGEDMDWCFRVWRAGLEVRYVPDAVVVHRWRQVTRTNLYGRNSWRALRDWFYLHWKHRALRGDPRLTEANA